MKQGGTFPACKRNARSMKLNETEWDNVGRDGTTWDEMGRDGTTSNIYEKPNVFWAAKTRTTRFQTATLQIQHFKQQPDKKRT